MAGLCSQSLLGHPDVEAEDGEVPDRQRAALHHPQVPSCSFYFSQHHGTHENVSDTVRYAMAAAAAVPAAPVDFLLLCFTWRLLSWHREVDTSRRESATVLMGSPITCPTSVTGLF